MTPPSWKRYAFGPFELDADDRLLMHEGAIAARGSADTVLQPAVLEKVFGLSMQRIVTDVTTQIFVLPHIDR